MIDRALNRILEDNGLVFRLLRRLLYGRKLRETSAELKAKGDFRAEGLRGLTLYGWLVHLACISGIAFPVGHLWKHWNTSTVATNLSLLFLAGFCVVFAILIWPVLRGRRLVRVATGTIAEGVILDARSWPGLSGWYIDYRFTDLDGVARKGTDLIGKHRASNEKPREGDHILVVLDPNNVKKQAPLVPGDLRKNCISWSRFRQLADEPFIRR